jgi:hypothetical protein
MSERDAPEERRTAMLPGYCPNCEAAEGEVMAHCPNCTARLSDDGTCHKCWWRPPTIESDRRVLSIVTPLALTIAAAVVTYWVATDATSPRWAACISLWILAVVSAVRFFKRPRKGT